MLKKLLGKKGQKGASANQEQGSSEKGKPNYPLLVFAVLLMVGGVGTVGYKFLMSGGQQQQVSVDRSVIQDQGQSQKQSQSSDSSGDDVLSKLQEEGSGAENPLGSSDEKSGQSAPDMKEDKPAERDKTQKKVASDSDRKAKKPGDRQNASETEMLPQRPDPRGEISSKLDAIKKAVNSGFEDVRSDIQGVEQELAENREQIDKLKDRVREVAESGGNGGGIDPEKYASLKAEEAKLKSRVADLKKRVEDLDGKYDWVRHLEKKRRKKLKEKKEELAKVKKKLKQRPVFADWAMVGLSEDEVVLKNKYDGTIRRLSEGDTFKDVKIKDISFEKQMVHTGAGVVSKGRN